MREGATGCRQSGIAGPNRLLRPGERAGFGSGSPGSEPGLHEGWIGGHSINHGGSADAARSLPHGTCDAAPSFDIPRGAGRAYRGFSPPTRSAVPTTTREPRRARRRHRGIDCRRRGQIGWRVAVRAGRGQADCLLADPAAGPGPGRAARLDPPDAGQSHSRSCTAHRRRAIPGRAAPCCRSFPTRAKSRLPHLGPGFFPAVRSTFSFPRRRAIPLRASGGIFISSSNRPEVVVRNSNISSNRSRI
jgi:hypothetical protein